jgi:hypothetical protein
MAEKQIFIKIEKYNDAIDVIELVKNKIKESKILLQKIKQLKSQEDSMIEKWSSELNEMEKKIAQVSEVFSESGE